MEDKAKILIVDDRPENLVALETLLSDLEVEFVQALSGNEALSQMLENEFAMALIDVQMPDMDGFETVELLRKDKRGKYLPVIFISAIYKEDYWQVKGIEKGAVDFITKPIVPEILLGKVRVFLDLYLQRKKLEKAYKELQFAHDKLKRSQELIHTEKMKALGMMTAGVAHELNNPLMGILNFIQYCLKRLPIDDKKHEILKDAEEETRRCGEIVQNLLAFSHMEPGEEEKFRSQSLEKIFIRILRILSYKIEQLQVQVEMNVKKDLPSVWAQTGAIQQVFFNIIENSLDALRKSQEPKIEIKAKSTGQNVTIEIKDNGPGIPQDILDRIFDPFFTTKATGDGTGLGLSLCQSIIENHKGTINCVSIRNKETKLVIELPISGEK